MILLKSPFSAHASLLRAGDTTLNIDAEATTVHVALLRQAEAEYSRNAPTGAGKVSRTIAHRVL